MQKAKTQAGTAPSGVAGVIGRVSQDTLQKKVYDQLRQAFLESRFMPGQTLTMRALAESTGVSVQPVREALQRLCAEGALLWLPNTAFRVPDIDPERYRELWLIRKLLEGQATRLAAARMEASEVADLRRINREMRAAMKAGDAEGILRLNRDFHFTIYDAAASPILSSLIEMIWMQVSPLFAASTQHELGRAASGLGERLPAAAQDFFTLQDAVIAAIAERDEEAAVKALNRVLDLSANLFSQSTKPDAAQRPRGSARRRR